MSSVPAITVNPATQDTNGGNTITPATQDTNDENTITPAIRDTNGKNGNRKRPGIFDCGGSQGVSALEDDTYMENFSESMRGPQKKMKIFTRQRGSAGQQNIDAIAYLSVVPPRPLREKAPSYRRQAVAKLQKEYPEENFYSRQTIC